MVKLIRASACAVLALTSGFAQRGSSDWMTAGFDAQRSSWVRADPKISKESMQTPGFALVWKLRLKNDARQLNSLTPPSLLDFYISYRGFRTLGFIGGSSDTVIGVDVDLARIEWEKKFPSNSPAVPPTLACPGGLTTNVTRPTVTPFSGVGGGGRGRGNPAKSGVGAPGEGAVTLQAQRQGPPSPPPAPPKPGGRPAAPAPNPFGRSVLTAVAITGDGMLHSMYVSNGDEPNPPIQFLPPNANAHGLIVFDGVAYVATRNGCGGVDNGLWALDLATKQVSHWKSGGKGIAGEAGAAVGPEGMLYVAGGAGELVGLEPKTLAKKASFQAPGMEFTSSPVVMDAKGKTMVAVTTNDGVLHVFDEMLMPITKSPAFAPGYHVGGLASWQDAAGVRWIMAPTSTGVVAWKFTGDALQPGWTSPAMVSATTPVIVNGVVFALSSGEMRTTDAKMTAAQVAKASKPAVLYALDAATGKEMWNSGATMTSFTHSGGISVGGGRVYVGTWEGTQYAFGFPMEH